MSHYDYLEGRRLAMTTTSYYGLIQAAMRLADTDNLEILKRGWPRVWEELQARYNAPGGFLPAELALPEMETAPSETHADAP